jgi:hypothetical protein
MDAEIPASTGSAVSKPNGEYAELYRLRAAWYR